MLTNLNAFHPMGTPNLGFRPQMTPPQTAPSMTPVSTPGSAQPMAGFGQLPSQPGQPPVAAGGPNTQFPLNPAAAPGQMPPSASASGDPTPNLTVAQHLQQMQQWQNASPGATGQSSWQSMMPQWPTPMQNQGQGQQWLNPGSLTPNWMSQIQFAGPPLKPTPGTPQPFPHQFQPPTITNPVQHNFGNMQMQNRFHPSSGVLGS